MKITSLGLFASLLVIGCSSQTVHVGGGPAMEQKQTATMARAYAQKTPPSNAVSMGMMSAPKAGSTTIPIQSVEVYKFTANIDDDTSGEELFWAFDGDVVYVWGTIDLECVDDDDAPTGETGVATFILEADDFGYGWMVSTDACGYSTLYGCSADEGDEVCGGCDWDDQMIVCDAD
jgi:hypothetical protein